MRVGFAGLGAMGLPMARNLIRAGHSVTVYNRTRERAAELESAGAMVGESPADAARNAEAVITMLADDRAVEQVVFAEGALLDSMAAGAVHISMSTISVALSRRLQEAHAANGQGYIAAPVFGRPEAAAAQKLWIVASGAPEQVERFRPLFDAMGRGTSVLGPEPWKANVVKLAGNFLIASMLEALGEAFTLGRKSGIAPDQLLEIVNSALFNSPLYANYGARVAREEFEPAGFKLRLGLKDVRLVIEAAEAAEMPLPLASLIRDHMLTAIAGGMGDVDWSAFAVVNAEAAGLSRTAGGR
jgi:3-hydroxyisobutyrate dehydrogenase-like beta-hydroxyacid dehydrogenase